MARLGVSGGVGKRSAFKGTRVTIVTKKKGNVDGKWRHDKNQDDE
jgi:hypothetical protein